MCPQETGALLEQQLGRWGEYLSASLLRQQIFSQRVYFSAEIKTTFLQSLMMRRRTGFSHSFNFPHACFYRFQSRVSGMLSQDCPQH